MPNKFLAFMSIKLKLLAVPAQNASVEDRLNSEGMLEDSLYSEGIL